MASAETVNEGMSAFWGVLRQVGFAAQQLRGGNRAKLPTTKK